MGEVRLGLISTNLGRGSPITPVLNADDREGFLRLVGQTFKSEHSTRMPVRLYKLAGPPCSVTVAARPLISGAASLAFPHLLNFFFTTCVLEAWLFAVAGFTVSARAH